MDFTSITTWLTKKHPGTGDPQLDIIYSAISVALVLMGGLMSGLTLGLMSLDKVDIEVLKRSGTEKEKQYASRIAPVLQRPHLLLVTLLICNAAANEALPLFLDRLLNPVSAVLMSVTVVLLFGEIIPQALCSRYGLAIGASCATFVQLLIYLCWVVAYPISKILDAVLGGEHSALFRRAQLKALVEVHEKKTGFGGNLSLDEVRVIHGALDATSKTAEVVMTPLEKVSMLPADALLDEETFLEIMNCGHSRLPVYRPGNREEVLGVLLVKDLLMVDKSKAIPVYSAKVRTLPILLASTSVYDLLKLFETGRSHMAVVAKPYEGANADSDDFSTSEDEAYEAELAAEEEQLFVHGYPDLDSKPRVTFTSFREQRQWVLGYNCCAIGIVTIEDVIEELLQQEIVDETDTFVDNTHTKRVNAAMIMHNLPPRLRRLAVAQVPRIGPVKAIDYTQGTDPRLRDWHAARVHSLKDAIANGIAPSNSTHPSLGGGGPSQRRLTTPLLQVPEEWQVDV